MMARSKTRSMRDIERFMSNQRSSYSLVFQLQRMPVQKVWTQVQTQKAFQVLVARCVIVVVAFSVLVMIELVQVAVISEELREEI